MKINILFALISSHFIFKKSIRPGEYWSVKQIRMVDFFNASLVMPRNKYLLNGFIF